jgi:hypothetical protein
MDINLISYSVSVKWFFMDFCLEILYCYFMLYAQSSNSSMEIWKQEDGSILDFLIYYHIFKG